MKVPASKQNTEIHHLVETSRAIQQEISDFRLRYEQSGQDAPLPPKSLRKLQDGRRRYLELQNRLIELARRYEPLTAADTDSALDPVERFKGLSVSLLAALTLYDNYLSLLTIFKDGHLRHLLEHPDYGYGLKAGALIDLAERLSSKQARDRLHRLLDSWTEAGEVDFPEDNAASLLRKEIESSVSYRYAGEEMSSDYLPGQWQLHRIRFMDSLDHLASEAIGEISKVFGNGIGYVEIRKGKLYRDQTVLDDLKSTLRPLDMLLEKTPFRLTDYLIPGHFGHVAIWVGTDSELARLGLWAQPEMEEEPFIHYRDQIRTGHSVLEALRTGVELNTLEAFLNVDDVAILRPNSLTASQTMESLIRGFRQVGKEYDFNFDVETTSSIVCSELPYHVYPGVQWQTSSQLGRFTISPDQVVSQALSAEGAFDLVAFYHDGKRVDEKSAQQRLRLLVQGD